MVIVFTVPSSTVSELSERFPDAGVKKVVDPVCGALLTATLCGNFPALKHSSFFTSQIFWDS